MSTWAHWRVYAIKAARWLAEAAVVVFLVVMIVAAAAVHAEEICLLYQGNAVTVTVQEDGSAEIWQAVAPVNVHMAWTGGISCPGGLCWPVTVLFEEAETWYLMVKVWGWGSVLTSQEAAAGGGILAGEETCVPYVSADTRLMFGNGFESGNLCAWSGQQGGATRPGWRC